MLQHTSRLDLLATEPLKLLGRQHHTSTERGHSDVAAAPACSSASAVPSPRQPFLPLSAWCRTAAAAEAQKTQQLAGPRSGSFHQRCLAIQLIPNSTKLEKIKLQQPGG